MSIFPRVGWVFVIAAGTALASLAGAQTTPQAAPSTTLPVLPAPDQADASSPKEPAPSPAPRVETQVRRPEPAPSDIPDTSPSNPPAMADPWKVQPFVIESQLGLGAPLGLIGIALDYSPMPVLGLNVGVGLGLGGVQYAFAARLRVIRWGHRNHFAAYLGAGVSAGGYNTDYAALDTWPEALERPSPHYHWDTAYWTNLEAGIDMRIGSHLSLRPFFGVALVLNPNAGVAVIGAFDEHPSKVESVPYVGLAVGYAPVAGW